MLPSQRTGATSFSHDSLGTFARLNIVEIRAQLVALVPDLVVRHPLRGYDAVQLATALTIRATGQAVEFWAADVLYARRPGQRAFES